MTVPPDGPGGASAVDHLAQFEREAAAFDAAVRVAAAAAAAPAVPSCPGWTVTDLALHLGQVHRLVTKVIAGRPTVPADVAGTAGLGLPAEQAEWLARRHSPAGLAVPGGLADWFRAGARELAEVFRGTPPAERVWTWWPPDQSAGFWLRMQAIEAAVHRWDAENATGAAGPVPRDFAADAIAQTFEVMVPARRARGQAPPGEGERYLFASTDGAGEWAVVFGAEGARPAEPGEGWDLRLAGPASDLMLFLWGRAGPDALALTGDRALADRFFTLVPPT